MFLASFAPGDWQSNCYLAGADDTRECVIVDPGPGASVVVHEILAEHRRRPIAILATHGHPDHVGDAAALSEEFSVPVWIHSADQPLLDDPYAGVSADISGWLAVVLPDGMDTPKNVEHYDGHEALELAGLRFGLLHAPGHTGGSMLLHVELPGDEPPAGVVFSGDVLFAGTVGRTDLPVSDPAAMRRTLAGPVLGLPDPTTVLPGHGSPTLIARERANNPYLQPAYLGL